MLCIAFFIVKLCVYFKCRYAERHCAEWFTSSVVKMNAIRTSVIIANVVALKEWAIENALKTFLNPFNFKKIHSL